MRIHQSLLPEADTMSKQEQHIESKRHTSASVIGGGVN
jgi:hypothetical protein